MRKRENSRLKNQIRLLCLVLVTTGFVAAVPFHRGHSRPVRREKAGPSRCTKEALAALKLMPKLHYECGENDDDDLKSLKRRAALKAYSRRLESSARAGWWAASVDDLNACAITHEARPLTDDERREFDAYIVLSGDQSTRLLVVPDPCVKYSYMTRNAFVLERAGGRVYATEVLDAYYTRADPGVSADLASQNGQRLVIVETNLTDGSMPPSLSGKFSVFAIDPGSHRAVPEKLFMDQGKLTNEFEYPQYLFDDEELSKQWHWPELVQSGRLSPRFDVYTLYEDKFTRTTYVWNGKYYALH